nr:hypothetical protein [Asgard group archaeon]
MWKREKKNDYVTNELREDDLFQEKSKTQASLSSETSKDDDSSSTEVGHTQRKLHNRHLQL